jgi:predicted N-acetyltransferase YhbS
MASAANPASSSGRIRTREADASDVEALTRVINAAFVVERVVFDGDRVDVLGVRACMQNGTFLVAEDGHALVGCVYVQLLANRAHLGLLSVEPTKQGRGLGQHLMQSAERFARDAGAAVMDLRVISARAELLSFYERGGYRQTGTAPFPPDLKTKIPAYYLLLSKPLK